MENMENLNASMILNKCLSTIGPKYSQVTFSLDRIKSTLDEFLLVNQLNVGDFYKILSIFVLTCLFFYTTRRILVKLIAQNLNYGYKDRRKLEEAGSNLCAYFIFACWEMYLIQYKYPELLTNLSSHWSGWSREMEVPNGILYLYYGQIAFYSYSVYAVLFVDDRRKDTLAMLLHHFIANSLIIFSLSVRYHLIGLVVLYFHDIADVCIGVAKVFDGITKYVKSIICEAVKNVAFLALTFSWVYFRLYLYPQIVLLSSCHVSVVMLNEPELYLMFNTLLFLLFGLNLYWFYFIVLVIIRIFESKDLADTREYEIHNANGNHKGITHMNGKTSKTK